MVRSQQCKLYPGTVSGGCWQLQSQSLLVGLLAVLSRHKKLLVLNLLQEVGRGIPRVGSQPPVTGSRSALKREFDLTTKGSAPNLPLYQWSFLYLCLSPETEFVELTVWMY